MKAINANLVKCLICYIKIEFSCQFHVGFGECLIVPVPLILI